MNKNYFSFVEDIVNRILCLKRDNRGSHNYAPIEEYVKYIIFKLISGCSWDNFNFLPNIPFSGDTLRKKFNYWSNSGIFNDQFHELVNILLKNENIKNAYMDSFDILNYRGSKNDVAIGYKYKNKNALRTNIIATENCLPLAVDFYPANINDNQRIEKILDQMTFKKSYNDPFKVVADLGYIINKERNQQIRSKYHVTIVTSKRKNMKKKRITNENKKLLKKRICIEHFHAKLKSKFKQLRHVTEKGIEKIKRWFLLSFSYLLLEYFENNGIEY